MSIGAVLAEAGDYYALDGRYYVLEPEWRLGGMFSDALFPEGLPHTLCPRAEAVAALRDWLVQSGVRVILAYNAPFDRRLLPELGNFCWCDILRLAAYRQFNPHIPAHAECCSTGRLKRNYGVEPMLRLLAGDGSYSEQHNALCDAADELRIMRLLGLGVEQYIDHARLP